MKKVIDVIDMEDPVLSAHRESVVLRDAPVQDYQPEIIRLWGMSNGVAEMVSQIIRRAPGGGIHVLRIWSHGWPGGQIVAAGGNGQAAADHRSALWMYNLSAYTTDLIQLSGYFAPGGRIELKGCSVAGGDDGERLIVGLARIIGVPVRAATVVQGGAGTFTQPGDSWNGPVIEADRSGALHSVNYSFAL